MGFANYLNLNMCSFKAHSPIPMKHIFLLSILINKHCHIPLEYNYLIKKKSDHV